MLPLKLSSFLNEDFNKFFLMLMMLRIIFNGINATDTMQSLAYSCSDKPFN